MRRSTLVLSIAMVWLAPWAATPAQARAATPGRLTVRVLGLPSGQRPAVVVTSGHTRRTLTRARSVLRLPGGTYVVAARRVTLRRISGARKDAVAYPSVRRRTVRVRAGARRTVTVDYATIVNAGVRTLTRGVVRVVGPADDPTGLVLTRAGGRSLKRGTILTSGPTKLLTHGMLHRVVTVKPSANTTTVTLAAAAVTDAVPRLLFDDDAQLSTVRATPNVFTAELQAGDGPCDIGFGGLIKPNFRVANYHPHIDINATPWGPGGIHADLTASMRLTLGFQVVSSNAFSCELRADAITAVGAIPVGPLLVPIYFTIPLTATFHAQAATTATRSLSFSTTLGMRTHRQGRLLLPEAVYDHGAVDATSTDVETAEYDLALSAGAELGVGVPKVANIHATLGTDLTFTRANARCDLDWNIGTLSGGGQVGILKLGTPTFTPQTVHLWDGCRDLPPLVGLPKTTFTRLSPVTDQGAIAPGFTVTENSPTGTCSEGSEVGQAYRCFAGHFVLDPCYAVAEPGTGDGTGVVCVTSPFTNDLFAITTATGVGRLDPSPFDEPNGIILSSGARCQLGQGAHSADSAGRVIDYACDDNVTSVLRGLNETGPLWTADVVRTGPNFTYIPAGTQAITAAVLLQHDVPPANRPVTDAAGATAAELDSLARQHHEVDCGPQSTVASSTFTEQIFDSGTPCFEANLIVTEWDNGFALEAGWSCAYDAAATLLCEQSSPVDIGLPPAFFASTHIRAISV